MDYKICEESKMYNKIYKRVDQLYHNIAVKLGISDTVFWIFHLMCETDVIYTQNQLAESLGAPKQTINSAISNLIKEGYLISIHKKGEKNTKTLHLTPLGVAYCEENIMPVVIAENNAYAKFSAEEMKLFFNVLNRKYEYIEEELSKTILKDQ